jgi:hypothetical protein
MNEPQSLSGLVNRTNILVGQLYKLTLTEYRHFAYKHKASLAWRSSMLAFFDESKEGGAGEKNSLKVG